MCVYVLHTYMLSIYISVKLLEFWELFVTTASNVILTNILLESEIQVLIYTDCDS